MLISCHALGQAIPGEDCNLSPKLRRKQTLTTATRSWSSVFNIFVIHTVICQLTWYSTRWGFTMRAGNWNAYNRKLCDLGRMWQWLAGTDQMSRNQVLCPNKKKKTNLRPCICHHKLLLLKQFASISSNILKIKLKRFAISWGIDIFLKWAPAFEISINDCFLWSSSSGNFHLTTIWKRERFARNDCHGVGMLLTSSRHH